MEYQSDWMTSGKSKVKDAFGTWIAVELFALPVVAPGKYSLQCSSCLVLLLRNINVDCSCIFYIYRTAIGARNHS